MEPTPIQKIQEFRLKPRGHQIIPAEQCGDGIPRKFYMFSLVIHDPETAGQDDSMDGAELVEEVNGAQIPIMIQSVPFALINPEDQVKIITPNKPKLELVRH